MDPLTTQNLPASADSTVDPGTRSPAFSGRFTPLRPLPEASPSSLQPNSSRANLLDSNGINSSSSGFTSPSQHHLPNRASVPMYGHRDPQRPPSTTPFGNFGAAKSPYVSSTTPSAPSSSSSSLHSSSVPTSGYSGPISNPQYLGSTSGLGCADSYTNPTTYIPPTECVDTPSSYFYADPSGLAPHPPTISSPSSSSSCCTATPSLGGGEGVGPDLAISLDAHGISSAPRRTAFSTATEASQAFGLSASPSSSSVGRGLGRRGPRGAGLAGGVIQGGLKLGLGDADDSDDGVHDDLRLARAGFRGLFADSMASCGSSSSGLGGNGNGNNNIGSISTGGVSSFGLHGLDMAAVEVERTHLRSQVRTLQTALEQSRTDISMLMRQLKDSQTLNERLQAEVRVSERNEKGRTKELVKALEDERERSSQLSEAREKLAVDNARMTREIGDVRLTLLQCTTLLGGSSDNMDNKAGRRDNSSSSNSGMENDLSSHDVIRLANHLQSKCHEMSVKYTQTEAALTQEKSDRARAEQQHQHAVAALQRERQILRCRLQQCASVVGSTGVSVVNGNVVCSCGSNGNLCTCVKLGIDPVDDLEALARELANAKRALAQQQHDSDQKAAAIEGRHKEEIQVYAERLKSVIARCDEMEKIKYELERELMGMERARQADALLLREKEEELMNCRKELANERGVSGDFKGEIDNLLLKLQHKEGEMAMLRVKIGEQTTGIRGLEEKLRAVQDYAGRLEEMLVNQREMIVSMFSRSRRRMLVSTSFAKWMIHRVKRVAEDALRRASRHTEVVREIALASKQRLIEREKKDEMIRKFKQWHYDVAQKLKAKHILGRSLVKDALIRSREAIRHWQRQAVMMRVRNIAATKTIGERDRAAKAVAAVKSVAFEAWMAARRRGCKKRILHVWHAEMLRLRGKRLALEKAEQTVQATTRRMLLVDAMSVWRKAHIVKRGEEVGRVNQKLKSLEEKEAELLTIKERIRREEEEEARRREEEEKHRVEEETRREKERVQALERKVKETELRERLAREAEEHWKAVREEQQKLQEQREKEIREEEQRRAKEAVELQAIRARDALELQRQQAVEALKIQQRVNEAEEARKNAEMAARRVAEEQAKLEMEKKAVLEQKRAVGEAAERAALALTQEKEEALKVLMQQALELQKKAEEEEAIAKQKRESLKARDAKEREERERKAEKRLKSKERKIQRHFEERIEDVNNRLTGLRQGMLRQWHDKNAADAERTAAICRAATKAEAGVLEASAAHRTMQERLRQQRFADTAAHISAATTMAAAGMNNPIIPGSIEDIPTPKQTPPTTPAPIYSSSSSSSLVNPYGPGSGFAIAASMQNHRPASTVSSSSSLSSGSYLNSAHALPLPSALPSTIPSAAAPPVSFSAFLSHPSSSSSSSSSSLIPPNVAPSLSVLQPRHITPSPFIPRYAPVPPHPLAPVPPVTASTYTSSSSSHSSHRQSCYHKCRVSSSSAAPSSSTCYGRCECQSADISSSLTSTTSDTSFSDSTSSPSPPSSSSSSSSSHRPRTGSISQQTRKILGFTPDKSVMENNNINNNNNRETHRIESSSGRNTYQSPSSRSCRGETVLPPSDLKSWRPNSEGHSPSAHHHPKPGNTAATNAVSSRPQAQPTFPQHPRASVTDSTELTPERQTTDRSPQATHDRNHNTTAGITSPSEESEYILQIQREAAEAVAVRTGMAGEIVKHHDTLLT